MCLSPHSFSPTHGSFACFYLNMHEPDKLHPSKIYLENPKKLNQSFNAFRMSFRKTDKNGGAHGKHLTSIYSGKVKPPTGGNHQKPLTLNQSNQ